MHNYMQSATVSLTDPMPAKQQPSEFTICCPKFSN